MVEFFKDVIAHEELHAKWLNTFSYLEYLGVRRIVKKIDEGLITLDHLSHISDEAGHAHYFKKIGHQFFKTFSSHFDEESLVGKRICRDYYQAVDQIAIDHSQNGHPSSNIYLLVSLVVEERAVRLYSSYHKALVQNHMPFNLKDLLLEEADHLKTAKAKLSEREEHFKETFDILLKEENDVFQVFFKKMQSISSSHVRPYAI